MRTTLVARMRLLASRLQIEGTFRGLLKIYGLKIGAIHRNRSAAPVLKLLEQAALPELSAAIEPLLRVREVMRAERKAADRALGALLGLTPRVYQSGEIDRSGKISKCRDRMLRHLFIGAERAPKWSRLRAWVSPSASAGA
jgi:transposase